MTEKQQDETIKDRIMGLLRKGYTRSQLTNDLGFKERTVDAAIRVYKESSYGNAEDAKESNTAVADDEASIPTSKSGGKGATRNSGRKGVLAIRKEKESVLPEWLEADVAEIFDGQKRDQRIFLAGMSVPLMGLRLFAEGVKPIIDLLATWQEGQAQASRAAQGSGIEMAREAGEVAASGVAKFFMDTKPWLSASPDPLKAMVVDTMRPVFQQVFGQLTGTFLRGFGMPQAGSPGQPMPQNPPQGQTPLSTPGVEQIGKDEMEEVFKDG